MKKLSCLLLLLCHTLLFGDDGKLELAINYYNEGNYQKSLEYFKQLASEGNMDAQFYMGLLYYNGYGFIKNNKLALYWFENAAFHGHVEAAYNTGYCYDNGYGTVKDVYKALKYYNVSAKKGNPYAQYQMASKFYIQGIRIVKELNNEALKNISNYTIYQLNKLGHNDNNFKYSYYWALLAQANGDERVKKKSDDLIIKLEVMLDDTTIYRIQKDARNNQNNIMK